MSSSFNSEGVIVVNCGAASWVAGFADEGGPTLVLPSSTEWSSLEQLWRSTYDSLSVEPSSHPVLLTGSEATPGLAHQTMRFLFDELHVPAFCAMSAPLLALMASNRTTGVVLDVGESATRVIPFFEGHALLGGGLSTTLAGASCDALLARALDSQAAAGAPSHRPLSSEELKTLKETHGFVVEALGGATPVGAPPAAPIIHELEDGTIIRLGAAARSASAEALFRPQLAINSGINVAEGGSVEGGSVEGGSVEGGSARAPLGVHELVHRAVELCSTEVRSELYANILICGGTSLFTGFAWRLEVELRALTGREVRIIATPERMIAPWLGGAQCAELDSFETHWLAKKTYETHAADAATTAAKGASNLRDAEARAAAAGEALVHARFWVPPALTPADAVKQQKAERVADARTRREEDAAARAKTAVLAARGRGEWMAAADEAAPERLVREVWPRLPPGASTGEARQRAIQDWIVPELFEHFLGHDESTKVKRGGRGGGGGGGDGGGSSRGELAADLAAGQFAAGHQARALAATRRLLCLSLCCDEDSLLDRASRPPLDPLVRARAVSFATPLRRSLAASFGDRAPPPEAVAYGISYSQRSAFRQWASRCEATRRAPARWRAAARLGARRRMERAFVRWEGRRLDPIGLRMRAIGWGAQLRCARAFDSWWSASAARANLAQHGPLARARRIWARAAPRAALSRWRAANRAAHARDTNALVARQRLHGGFWRWRSLCAAENAMRRGWRVAHRKHVHAVAQTKVWKAWRREGLMRAAARQVRHTRRHRALRTAWPRWAAHAVRVPRERRTLHSAARWPSDRKRRLAFGRWKAEHKRAFLLGASADLLCAVRARVRICNDAWLRWLGANVRRRHGTVLLMSAEQHQARRQRHATLARTLARWTRLGAAAAARRAAVAHSRRAPLRHFWREALAAGAQQRGERAWRVQTQVRGLRRWRAIHATRTLVHAAMRYDATDRLVDWYRLLCCRRRWRASYLERRRLRLGALGGPAAAKALRRWRQHVYTRLLDARAESRVAAALVRGRLQRVVVRWQRAAHGVALERAEEDAAPRVALHNDAVPQSAVEGVQRQLAARVRLARLKRDAWRRWQRSLARQRSARQVECKVSERVCRLRAQRNGWRRWRAQVAHQRAQQVIQQVPARLLSTRDARKDDPRRGDEIATEEASSRAPRAPRSSPLEQATARLIELNQQIYRAARSSQHAAVAAKFSRENVRGAAAARAGRDQGRDQGRDLALSPRNLEPMDDHVAAPHKQPLHKQPPYEPSPYKLKLARERARAAETYDAAGDGMKLSLKLETEQVERWSQGASPPAATSHLYPRAYRL